MLFLQVFLVRRSRGDAGKLANVPRVFIAHFVILGRLGIGGFTALICPADDVAAAVFGSERLCENRRSGDGQKSYDG